MLNVFHCCDHFYFLQNYLVILVSAKECLVCKTLQDYITKCVVQAYETIYHISCLRRLVLPEFQTHLLIILGYMSQVPLGLIECIIVMMIYVFAVNLTVIIDNFELIVLFEDSAVFVGWRQVLRTFQNKH